MRTITFILFYFSFLQAICSQNLNPKTEKDVYDYLNSKNTSLDKIEGIYKKYNMLSIDNGAWRDKGKVLKKAIIRSTVDTSEFLIYEIESSGILKINEDKINKSYAYKYIIPVKKDPIKDLEFINGNSFQSIVVEQYDTELGLLRVNVNYDRIYPTKEDIQVWNLNSKPKIGTGTGFLINESLIITNYHVIKDAKKIELTNSVNNKEIELKLIGYDKANDLAILKPEQPLNKKKNPISITFTSQLQGKSIFVLGYPLVETMGKEVKLTNGIISSQNGFQDDITSYQISAPIQPGNSGSPVFSMEGKLIGIASSKHSEAEGVGYCIKTSYLKLLLESYSISIDNTRGLELSKLKFEDKIKTLKDYVFNIQVEY